MFRKVFLLLLLIFCLQSCFYTPRAREVGAYEIDKPKKEGEGISTMIFEYTGNPKRFEPLTMSFFNIKENYLPFSFISNTLYGGEDLNVYMYFSKDKDKMLNLFSIVWNAIFYNSDDDDTQQEKDYNDEHAMELTEQKTHSYIHIQITDEEGNDILVEESMRNKAVMQKLNQYQRLID